MNIESFLLSLIVKRLEFLGDQDFKIAKNIKYGSHPRHEADFYLTSETNAPVVVVVHGGGWSQRQRSDMGHIAKSLASHGFNVLNMNYRLAPEFNHPAPIDDLKLALAFVKEKYQHVADFSKIAMWGYSAGAHISMYYALKEKDESVKAIVSGGGPFDFSFWPWSPLITPYMGYRMEDRPKGWHDASPINYLHKDAPAIFLYHAIKDRLVEHSQSGKFYIRAKELGVEVDMHHVYFWGHINAFLFDKESIIKGIEFIKQKTL